MAETLYPTSRVRDLVHSFVYLTEVEERVINHPLYQRLRNVAHNDISSRVYPSLNTTRFEHSIGTAHVAGKMAKSVSKSSGYGDFIKECEFPAEHFEHISRLYALLHDLGHPPLSHLFEAAFTDLAYKEQPKTDIKISVEKWTGNADFRVFHESLSYNYAKEILNDISDAADFKGTVLELLGSKEIPITNPLHIIKDMIDSDIDSDRIDSVTRDGILGGGEYGNYDIERLTSSPRVVNRNGYWVLAFDHKTISSLESLLFERYRTYTWIHFHHRLIALKEAARTILLSLLEDEEIKPEHFSVSNGEVTLLDDIWLWSRIRDFATDNDVEEIAKDALLFRKKEKSNLLWRNRYGYSDYRIRLMEKAIYDKVDLTELRKGDYEKKLSEYLGYYTKIHSVKFNPISDKKVFLYEYDKHSKKEHLLPRSLLDSSAITRNLNDIWRSEPQFYVVIFDDIRDEIDTLGGDWITFTAKHLSGIS